MKSNLNTMGPISQTRYFFTIWKMMKDDVNQLPVFSGILDSLDIDTLEPDSTLFYRDAHGNAVVQATLEAWKAWPFCIDGSQFFARDKIEYLAYKFPEFPEFMLLAAAASLAFKDRDTAAKHLRAAVHCNPNADLYYRMLAVFGTRTEPIFTALPRGSFLNRLSGQLRFSRHTPEAHRPMRL